MFITWDLVYDVAGRSYMAWMWCAENVLPGVVVSCNGVCLAWYGRFLSGVGVTGNGCVCYLVLA